MNIQKEVIRNGESGARPSETSGTSTSAPWPDPMAPEAYHGLAGDIVKAIEPHTEADPAALLVQFLAAFGNAIGVGPHFVADGARHTMKLNVAIVGETAKGRKGTSWARIRQCFECAAPEWAEKRVLSGLSSGEGMIWAVRDPIYKRERNKDGGEYRQVIADAGVDDKRLLVVEPELASTMAMMARQGSTLSPIIRDAWDKSNLRVMTKNSPAESTGAHVSIIGHVTGDELRRNLERTELGNGFANRFLWICARRARVLPFGGGVVDLAAHREALHAAIEFATATGSITWAAEARPIWAEVYPDLSAGQPGILGAVTARAEAQAVRLGCLYALLDCEREIRAEHLFAALAVWHYSAASARWIWGDSLGDPLADDLLRMLRGAGPDGMTRTQIRDALGRHRSGDEVGRAIGVLVQHERARTETHPTGGRPEERVVATATKATEATKGG